MITDLQAAELCTGIYAYKGEAPVVWDHYDLGTDTGAVCWGLKRIGEVDVLVLRGSTTLLDWRRDFDAWADPHDHGTLGPVHPGFLAGMRETWEEVHPCLRAEAPLVVTGHSLGAGRASILCGLMQVDGVLPARRIVFGEPKPGFAPLAELVGKIPAASYRNTDDHHHDLVCDVPFTFASQDYVRPTPWTKVTATPPAHDAWGVFAYHHMRLYRQALRSLL